MNLDDPLLMTDPETAWPDIYVPLLSVLKDEDETPEDIYRQLMEGVATLFTCSAGFLIVRVIPNQYTGGKDFLAYIAHSTGQHGQLLKRLPEIEELARIAGCEKVIMVANRPGHQRVMPPEWRLKHYIFERRL